MTTVEITIRNRLDDVARVRDLVATLATTHKLPTNVVFDMNVALDEVLSNIVKYGYPDDTIHEIRVALTVSHDTLVAEIDDDGRPFDLTTVPAPDPGVPLAERKIGGLGIHFVRKLMSEVTYSRVAGRNRLILKKPFRRP